MRRIKMLLVSIMLIFMIFSLSGCKFIEVQEEQKEAKEGAIKYLNSKYSSEPSFKKYERKDLKKVLDNNSGIFSYVSSLFCSIKPFCEFNYTASNYFQMKDGTIVVRNDKFSKGYTDNKQAEKITNDFKKYFYDSFFEQYNYTNETLTFLSNLEYVEYRKNNNNGQFAKYYDGTNINEIMYDYPLYVDGDVHIWIQPVNYESTCQEIENSLKSSKVYYKGTVYIYDINKKDSNVSDDDKKLGTLEIDVRRNKYDRNYRNIYYY